MADLIKEILVGCCRDDVSIETLLRRVKLASVKLSLPNLENWIDFELNGYPCKKNELPNYRIIQGEAKAKCPLTGWKPVLTENANDDLDRHLSTAYLFEPISGLLRSLDRNDNGLFVVLHTTKTISFLRAAGINIYEARVEISEGSVASVISCVKNRILDWACEMEKHGIQGTDFSFNEAEVDQAQTTTNQFFINNSGTFSGVIGNGNAARDINQNGVDLTKASDLFRQIRDLAVQLPIEVKENEEFIQAIQTLDTELKKDEPATEKVKSSFSILKRIAENISGSLAANGIVYGINMLL